MPAERLRQWWGRWTVADAKRQGHDYECDFKPTLYVVETLFDRAPWQQNGRTANSN